MSKTQFSLEYVLRKRESLAAQMELLDHMIAEMRVYGFTNGVLPVEALPEVKADEFKGKMPAQALHLYMNARRGHRISLDHIADDLLSGGVDPGYVRGKHKRKTAKKTLIHNLKISLRQKSEIEHSPQGSLGNVDGRDITVWVGAEIPDDATKRRKIYQAKKKKTESQQEINSQASNESSTHP